MVNEAGRVVDRRIRQCRAAVWLTVALLTFLVLRPVWPLAWQVSAFGAAVTLLWPLTGKRKEAGDSSHEDPEQAQEAQSRENSSAVTDSVSDASHRIEIGFDLIVATALIAFSGGFGSPFGPLVLVVVLEAAILLGVRAALSAALWAALLNLIHFRVGFSPQTAILYGTAMSAVLVAARLVPLVQRYQGLTEDGANGHGRDRAPRSSSLLKPPTIEELQQEIQTTSAAHRQLQSTYRELVQVHRSQQAQLTRMRLSEQMYEISLAGAFGEGGKGSGNDPFVRLLHLSMETAEAGSGVLWLRDISGNTLNVNCVAGNVAESIHTEQITDLMSISPSALRARCEAGLLRAAPMPAYKALESRLGRRPENRMVGAKDGNAEENAGEKAGRKTGEKTAADFTSAHQDLPALERRLARSASRLPRLADDPDSYLPASLSVSPEVTGSPSVAVVVLRGPETEDDPYGAVIGAVGLCEPRGQGRFLPSTLERLQSLMPPLALSIENLLQRKEAQQRTREALLLQDLSRLAQTATTLEEVYQRVVAQVVQHVPCENCTLFLLDAAQERLEPKITHGRVVNLLDHINFERGVGVSGWVGARGRPLHITDLTQAPDLLDIEMIPPCVRSFVAMPLRAEGRIIGVLNVSHARPHAFSRQEVRLLNRLADQAALTLVQILEPLAVTAVRPVGFSSGAKQMQAK